MMRSLVVLLCVAVLGALEPADFMRGTWVPYWDASGVRYPPTTTTGALEVKLDKVNVVAGLLGSADKAYTGTTFSSSDGIKGTVDLGPAGKVVITLTALPDQTRGLVEVFDAKGTRIGQATCKRFPENYRP